MNKLPGISAALICAASVLAVGGVHTQVAIAMVCMALPAALWVTFSRAGSTRGSNKKTGASDPISISLPSLIFSVFAFICFLQILPLPPPLQELASPQGRAIFLESSAVLHGPEASLATQHAWRPISMDPEQTADRGLRWVALALLALIGARLGSQRHAWRDMLRAGVALGWVHLIISGLHNLMGATRFFGIYEPLGSWPAFTMFVNSNQGAAFYGLSALCGLILAHYQLKKRRLESFFSGVSAIVFILFMLQLNSDGVNLAFGLTSVLYVGQTLWMVYRAAHPRPRGAAAQPGRARRVRTNLLQAASTLGMLTLMGAIITLPMWLSRTFLWPWIQSTPMGLWVETQASVRLVMTESGMRGALDYPFFGSGAGSIERIIAPYMDWSLIRPASIPTLENQFADWFLAMGYLPTIAAMALFLAGFAYISRKTGIFSPTTQSPRNAHRYLGLLAFAIYTGLLIQMHFPFFALGLASCIVVIFEVGLKSGRPSGSPRRAGWVSVRGLRLFVARRLAQGLLVVAVLGAGVFVFTWAKYASTRASGVGERAQAASEAQLDALVRAVPTESRIFTALAFKAARAEDGARAIALAEHAYKLEPRSYELLFLAHLEAHFGQKEKATDYYARLFGPAHLHTMYSLRAWVSKYLLQDIKRADRRARALHDAPAYWEYALGQISHREDKTRAIEFALALVEDHPDDFLANQLVVAAYLGAREFLVAQLWAEMMVAKDWPARSSSPADEDGFRAQRRRLNTFDPTHPDPHSASLALVARVLARSGDQARARQYLLNIKRPESGEMAEDVVKVVLELLPATPAGATPDEVALISRAAQDYCRKKRSRNEQRLCWSAEAWLDERHDRPDDARLVWERIARDYDDPLPLGEFFVRQRQCIALEQLITQHQPTRSRAATKWLGRLKALSRKCAAK